MHVHMKEKNDNFFQSSHIVSDLIQPGILSKQAKSQKFRSIIRNKKILKKIKRIRKKPTAIAKRSLY